MFWREGGVAKEGFMREGNMHVEYDRTVAKNKKNLM